MKDLPPRFTETSFRRWEQIIKTIVDIAPSRLTLNPRFDLSQETVSCRLRDAMRSLHENKWATVIDMPKFDSLYPTIQVAREGDLVVIQHKVPTKMPVIVKEITIAACSSTVIDSAMILREQKIIPPVFFTALTQEQLDRLHNAEQNGRVGLNETPNGVLMV